MAARRDTVIGAAAARLAERVLPALPAALDAPIGTLMGTAAYLLAAGPRRAVRANLAVLLPARADREALARQVFVWQVRHYLETFRLSRMDREALVRTVRVLGWDHVAAGLARGKGIILATAHLGPASVAAQILVARGLEVTLPVERQPSELGRAVNRARAAMGIKPVPTDSALGLRRLFRGGGVLGIVADRAVTGVGVRVPFCGREALLPSAPVVLALRTGAALVPAFAERDGTSFVARFEPELSLARTEDHDADVREGVRRLGEVLAAAIRRSPEEWSVFEPIWDRSA